MRSLSKVIKSDCVLYDRDPRMISFEYAGQAAVPQSANDVGHLLSKNALESADLSLKTAVDERAEIIRRGRIEAHIEYFEAISGGQRQGHEDGLVKGRGEGTMMAIENVRTAAEKFMAHVQGLDANYSEKLIEARYDCVDFAFGLADTILGNQADRHNEDYKKLIDGFLQSQPVKATIEVDGSVYPFETLQADGLLTCADGLQGLCVSAEVPCKIAAPEPADATELQEHNSEDERGAAGKWETEDEQETESERGAAGKWETENEWEAANEHSKTDIAEPSAQNASFFSDDTDTGRVVPEENQSAPPKTLVSESTAQNIHKDNRIEPELENTQNNESSADAEIEDEEKINSEKFVFVRPNRKSVIIPAETDDHGIQKIGFDDIARIGTDSLKALSKKADVKDIAVALSGAGDEVTSAFMNVLSRRTKEKVLEAMKYLGPMPQTEVADARDRLAVLAGSILKAHGGDGTDD